MIHKLIEWALGNPLIVILLAGALTMIGGYAFIHVNVEAYPDPAPAIVEVIAKFPGASAEEVERQVTIPLEVALAGMPGLKYTRSKSLFGLSHLRNQFEYGIDFLAARQEVINRLQFVDDLPSGVSPDLSPQSPTGEIMRYTLQRPPCQTPCRQSDVYTLNDFKAIQDWYLERQFRRVPRIIDIVSAGGTVKRYEVHPDPEALMRYGITLDQLTNAIGDSNANVGGDYLALGENMLNVRGIGLIGEGLDPMRSEAVLQTDNPREAANYLRAEEQRRLQRIRKTVITAVEHLPIRVENVVEGGPEPLSSDDLVNSRASWWGTSRGWARSALSQPDVRPAAGEEIRDASGNRVWVDEPDKVQGIVLLRKGEHSLPALHDLEEKIKELNESTGRMLPGVKIEPYYDRAELIAVTTETVRENLVTGMVLVTMILLMFLSNVRSALIVAVNIPLALLFAFSVLYMQGGCRPICCRSRRWSISALFRRFVGDHGREHLSPLEFPASTPAVHVQVPHSDGHPGSGAQPVFHDHDHGLRVFAAVHDERPRRTDFRTYGRYLRLRLGRAARPGGSTVAPVLCLLFFKTLKPAPDNALVRWMKAGYLRNLRFCLRNRWLTMGVMIGLVTATGLMLPFLGREFMPELEEGNLWIRGTFPINITLTEA